MTQDIDITDDEPTDIHELVNGTCDDLGIPRPDAHGRVLGTGWEFLWGMGDGYMLTFRDASLMGSNNEELVLLELEQLKRVMQDKGDL